MSEFESIARDAETIAAQPQGPVSHRDVAAIMALIARLARAMDCLPQAEPKRPVGRPRKAAENV
jgi:hypothetical protein